MKCKQCGTRELTSGDMDGLCCTCRNYNNSTLCIESIIKMKFKTWAANQNDVPAEYITIINKNFWELI